MVQLQMHLSILSAMRLDAFLFENGSTASRTEAKNFILEGNVTVNSKIVLKPSYSVLESDDVFIDKSSKKYVSRGGLKLEEALNVFKIDVKNALALDVGASSGGFTDCLLKHGALHVISVDSGSGQISESLRNSEKVTVIENYNARYMKPCDLEYVPDIAVMDVSFISATYILPSVYECLSENGNFVCLIKPQFEVGRSLLGKRGIVKNEKVRKNAVDKVASYAEKTGFHTEQIIRSPIEGGDGNIEYLAHFRKKK